MTCKNCNTSLSGAFCPNCGQKAKVERINFSNFVEEFTTSVFQIDRGFFYTMKALFVTPGASIRDFLEGKRKDYFKPIAYVLLLSTVYFFVTQLTGENTWIHEALLGIQEGANDAENGAKVPTLIQWLADHYAYATLLLIPVFSFASFLVFIPYKKNYLEHIVLNAYITGQQAIFYAVFALFHKASENDYFELIPFFIALPYCVWVYNTFFEGERTFVKTIRVLGTYLIHLVVCMAITILLIGLTNGFDH